MTIFNDHQLNVAKEQLTLLEKGYHPLQLGASEPLVLSEKQQKEVKELEEALTDAIDEYQSLRDGTCVPDDDIDLEGLGLFLVMSRIHKHITQSKMAKELGMGLIPFQNLESRFYSNANLTLLLKAVSILNADVKLRCKSRPDEDE